MTDHFTSVEAKQINLDELAERMPATRAKETAPCSGYATPLTSRISGIDAASFIAGHLS
jgi:hypothetical protein